MPWTVGSCATVCRSCFCPVFPGDWVSFLGSSGWLCRKAGYCELWLVQVRRPKDIHILFFSASGSRWSLVFVAKMAKLRRMELVCCHPSGSCSIASQISLSCVSLIHSKRDYKSTQLLVRWKFRNQGKRNKNYLILLNIFRIPTNLLCGRQFRGVQGEDDVS